MNSEVWLLVSTRYKSVYN